MKTNNIYLLLLIGCFSIGSYAQSVIESGTEMSSGFSSEESALDYLSTQAQIPLHSSSSTSNLVYIEQAGRDNLINTNVSAHESVIRIEQNGRSNYAYLDIVAKTIQQDILQDGNNNSFFNYTNAPNTEHTAEVLQNGNNTDVTIYGGNSLSEEMSISVQGSDRSVIVRNF